jgi:hypothetical protein
MSLIGGMKVKADRDESSPYAAMLVVQDVTTGFCEVGITALHVKLHTTGATGTKTWPWCPEHSTCPCTFWHVHWSHRECNPHLTDLTDPTRRKVSPNSTISDSSFMCANPLQGWSPWTPSMIANIWMSHVSSLIQPGSHPTGPTPHKANLPRGSRHRAGSHHLTLAKATQSSE